MEQDSLRNSIRTPVDDQAKGATATGVMEQRDLAIVYGFVFTENLQQ